MRAAALSLALGALGAFAGAPSAQAAGITLPEGPGADLVYARCRTCHDLQYVVDSAGLLPAQWNAVLQSMHDYGLKLPDAERAQILQYLSTWLGPHPPVAAAAAAGTAGAQAAAPAKIDGHALYERNCSGCHGTDARGEANRIPPLADNEDLRRDATLPILVVLHGLDGPIEVNGRKFDSSMPPFDHLSNAQIAALVNYVRDEAGANPDSEPVTADMVDAQRGRPLGPNDVHAYRARNH